jgi:DNA-binding protein YbaB
MMDQLALFKKAQEMAQKKQKLDEELQSMKFEGASPNGNVKVSFKFVPITNPMDPLPDYEAVSVDFDDAYYAASSPEELSTAVVEAIRDGIKVTNDAVVQKYATLQGDLMDAFRGPKQS